MTRRLAWSETFSVGHEALDAQHRDLINRINQLCAALDAQEDMTPKYPDLRALIHAVKEHFDHEMTILKDIVTGAWASIDAKAAGKTALDDHGSAHERSLTDLHAIVGKIEQSPSTTLPDYSVELVRWFANHSIKHDATLKTVFQTL